MKMPKRNRIKISNSKSIKILLSVLTGVITIIAGLLLLSLMIHNGQIAEENSGYGIMIIWFIASCLTSIQSFTASDSVKLLYILIGAGSLAVISVIINLLFMDGNLSGAGQCFIAMVLGCIIPVLFLMRKKQKISNRPKYHFQ